MNQYSDNNNIFKLEKAVYEEMTNTVDFNDIGGLTKHIRTLRELILFPLIYKDIYHSMNIRAPRGVLFYGPPGTGKTLIAKALANECSKTSQVRVTFFHRKGSDILDKWVGESEKKLRILFERASNLRPSVIFFDEIDALAPIRNSRQDQVHVNVVATLLALMDGLDSANGIVIIGATNRLNAIDPALRRAGRFDRELYFPLPSRSDRQEILKVNTRKWAQKPSEIFLKHLADITSGYCGSDLKALCSNAVLSCLKRTFPNIHYSPQGVNLNVKSLEVSEGDFMEAFNTIVPSSKKLRIIQHRLSKIIEPLLGRQLEDLQNRLQSVWPHFMENYQYSNTGTERYLGKLLIIGNQGQGHSKYLGPALLHCLEHLPVHTIDLQSMYESGSKEIEESIIQKFNQAQQCAPSIIYTPNVNIWWENIDHIARVIFMNLLEELNPETPILIIFTCDTTIPSQLNELLTTSNSLIYRVSDPNVNEREAFFAPLFLEKALNSPKKCTKKQNEEDNVTFFPRCDNNSSGEKKSRYSRRVRGLDAAILPSSEFVEQSMRMKVNNNRAQKRTFTSCFSNYTHCYGKRMKFESVHKHENYLPNCSNKQLERIDVEKPCDNLIHKIDNNETIHSTVDDVEKTIDESNNQIKKKTDLYVDITISRPKLMSLYQRTVKETSKRANCSTLEHLYDKLDSCIQSFQNVWNRNPLLEEIEIILNKFDDHLNKEQI